MLKPVVLPAAILFAGVISASAQTRPAAPVNTTTQHEHAAADTKAAGASLDELVRAMNEATGDAKVAAMASVVAELARQHQAMQGCVAMMDREKPMRMMDGRGMKPAK